MIPGVGPYSALITPIAGSLFHAVFQRLELACERALAAGVASSRYVERLLKADRRHPFLDAHAENGLGEHGNLRGPAYYN